MESFQNENYPFGIKLLQHEKVLVIFSLPNQDDCKNFVQDITESILEVKQMDALRIGKILITIFINKIVLKFYRICEI